MTQALYLCTALHAHVTPYRKQINELIRDLPSPPQLQPAALPSGPAQPRPSARYRSAAAASRVTLGTARPAARSHLQLPLRTAGVHLGIATGRSAPAGLRRGGSRGFLTAEENLPDTDSCSRPRGDAPAHLPHFPTARVKPEEKPAAPAPPRKHTEQPGEPSPPSLPPPQPEPARRPHAGGARRRRYLQHPPGGNPQVARSRRRSAAEAPPPGQRAAGTAGAGRGQPAGAGSARARSARAPRASRVPPAPLRPARAGQCGSSGCS